MTGNSVLSISTLVRNKRHLYSEKLGMYRTAYLKDTEAIRMPITIEYVRNYANYRKIKEIIFYPSSKENIIMFKVKKLV